jgi:predicted Zn finger-like uncharacterized protein
MLLTIQCPSCAAKVAVAEENVGKRVRCPKCAAVIQVAEKHPAPVPAAPTKNPAPVASAARQSIQPAPVPNPATSIHGRGASGPARPGGREEPKESAGRGWLLLGAALGCGALVFGAIVLGVGAIAWLALKPSAPSEPSLQAEAPMMEQHDPPVELPPMAPAAGPPPAQLEKELLQKAKKATVYLRVRLPNGDTAEGSGFFCLAPGVVVTNAHVLGMLRSDSQPPANVEVVAHSGEKDELKLTGTVLGVDRTNDLAVLKVGTDASRLPPPLSLGPASDLIETQKVIILGFPFGERLGRNITINESSVSSLRRDESGRLSQVQVNGGMHPGNSGGPVIDTRGAVVGVSVAVIRGTQINFAIPGELVREALGGRLNGSELGLAYQADGQIQLPVKLACLDPLNQIRSVKMEWWTGAPGDARPASTQAPRPQHGDGPRSSLPATLRDGAYALDVPLPAPPPGQVCWLQPVLIKASGQTTWEKAIPVPAEARVALERKPADLLFKPPTAAVERTLKANSSVSVTVYENKGVVALVEKMEGDVLESLNPDQRGTAVRLTLANCPFTRETPDKKLVPPPQAQALLRQYSPTFLVDASNACKERGNRNFNVLNPTFREIVENMFETICNTYESTTLPLPNRMVQPLETWPARMPMLVLARGKRQVQDIFVTCTYEGVRSVDGRTEAYIGLSGVVKGRGPRAALILGKARGHAHFDVDKGFLTLVTLTVSSELENEESGVRILVNDESTVRRQEGNGLGIQAATRNQPGGAPTPPRPPRPPRPIPRSTPGRN